MRSDSAPTRLPELLAPAGSPEALEAAFCAGADAVYLGGSAFNARMSAHNFDSRELEAAVTYAHARGGRVYLTLNTLVYDRELPDAVRAAYGAAAAGVDGLIIADLGAAEIPVVTVLNKCDLLTENIPEDDSTVKISAKKAQGIDRLLKVVAANLPETAKRMKLLLPYDKAGFTAKLRENAKVFTEEYTETGVLVDALVDQMLIKQMSQYETE